GSLHQMVSPGGTICWLSCGIGPVPAMPSGADSGGGAGSEDPGGGVCGQDRDGVAGAAGLGPDAGLLSPPRWAGGTAGPGRAGAAAGCSRVVSRLRSEAQSGSQHSCSLRASSSTCGSPRAASCFQASVVNGGKKSFLANSRFLELYRASQRPGSLLSATSDR